MDNIPKDTITKLLTEVGKKLIEESKNEGYINPEWIFTMHLDDGSIYKLTFERIDLQK